MSFKVVIPSRYGSSRLPGKPLLDIAGKPMVQRVWEQALKSGAEEVVVATDDGRIAEVVEAFGGECVMTSEGHVSGTDRIAEVSQNQGWSDDTIVVNLQGDEPLMPPALLTQVANDMASEPGAAISTLYTPIDTVHEFRDPNCVKVVFNDLQHALYFSRAPIPCDRDGQDAHLGYRHLGIYAFRAGFLREFSSTAPCHLEELEKLEQLRAMCLGRVIKVSEAEVLPGPGVDTPEDLQRVIRALEGGVER
ncbi:MAG: 3-deoxy-manno-octulosonate cytidylyltransferase [bacterium]